MDAAITVITKRPFSSTSPPRQDRTNPPLTNAALSGRLGTKAPDTSTRLPEDCWQLKDVLNAELDQNAVASSFLADKRASSIYLRSCVETTTRRHVKWSQSCPSVQDYRSGSPLSSLPQREQGGKSRDVAPKGDHPSLTRMGQGAKEEASLIN